jgi:hypothetical protein
LSENDIPSWAVRGAKVICIAEGFDQTVVDDPLGELRWPSYGVEYTIREVRVRFLTEYMELGIGVLLHEIENPIAAGGSSTGEEPGFHISAFQPVKPVRAETEIKIEEPAL